MARGRLEPNSLVRASRLFFTTMEALVTVKNCADADQVYHLRTARVAVVEKERRRSYARRRGRERDREGATEAHGKGSRAVPPTKQGSGEVRVVSAEKRPRANGQTVVAGIGQRHGLRDGRADRRDSHAQAQRREGRGWADDGDRGGIAARRVGGAQRRDGDCVRIGDGAGSGVEARGRNRA